jgi:DnaK suppressor protein
MPRTTTTAKKVAPPANKSHVRSPAKHAAKAGNGAGSHAAKGSEATPKTRSTAPTGSTRPAPPAKRVQSTVKASPKSAAPPRTGSSSAGSRTGAAAKAAEKPRVDKRARPTADKRSVTRPAAAAPVKPKSPPSKVAPARVAAKAAPGKQPPAKAAPSKPSIAREAAVPPPAGKSAATKPAVKQAPAVAPHKPTATYANDRKFLDSQTAALLAERLTYVEQAKSLRAEADSLVEEMEPGDIQFDEESGEGGTITVDRERDLALSAQALLAVEEIDHALAKIKLGTYGVCEGCGTLIPKNRLDALPYARLCIACKSGGLSRR